MDVLTIVWYFSTFLLLILFFVVMVCSDNVCNRRQNKPEDIVITAPPTPAPSYREFAPPGYDTVMKKYKNRIFIVPVENSNEPGIFAPRDMQSTSPISSSISSPVQSRISVHVPATVPEIVELQVTHEFESNRRRNSLRRASSGSIIAEDRLSRVTESGDSNVNVQCEAVVECEAVNIPVLRTTKNIEDDSRSSSG